MTNNQDCQRSRKTLQLLIEDRPEDIAQINQKIKQVFKSTNEPGANEEESEDDESLGICFLNTRQAKAVPQRKTLREMSPFNVHFLEIFNRFSEQESNYPSNPLYNRSYIDFLLVNYNNQQYLQQAS